MPQKEKPGNKRESLPQETHPTVTKGDPLTGHAVAVWAQPRGTPSASQVSTEERGPKEVVAASGVHAELVGKHWDVQLRLEDREIAGGDTSAPE